MKLVKFDVQFTTQPYLTQSIKWSDVYTACFRDFDKDGYEVPAPLERLYYEEMGIELNHDIQFHVAPVEPWYIDTENSEQDLVLDHCMILTRYAFAGQARSQLEQAVGDRPIIRKLLNIKPKYGIDFSLDYVTPDIVMEVIHIEQDFTDIEQANEAKNRLENIIENTDWLDGAHSLIRKRNQWEHLSSDDHSDFKAQYFGWHRAFDNKKVFCS